MVSYMEIQFKTTSDKQSVIDRLLLAHVFIGSLGLLKFIAIAAMIINNIVVTPYNTFINYSDWADFSTHTPNKLGQILLYIFSVVGLFFCYAYFIVLRDRADFLRDNRIVKKVSGNFQGLTFYFVSLCAVNLMVVLNPKYNVIVMSGLITIWFITFILPALPLIDRAFDNRRYDKLVKWFWTVLIVVIGGVLWLFCPYLTGSMPVRNEYMDIPSMTKLGDRYVNNTEYINQHDLGGINLYDPRKDKGASPSPRPGETILISNSAALTKLLFDKDMRNKYAYDERLKALVVKGKMSLNDWERLVRIAKNQKERVAINNFFGKETKRKSYSAEEIEFLKKNGVVLFQQTLAGYFFHHHNAMYGPINEFALGKPKTEINFVYGWLNTIIIAKLATYFGGVTFDNYLRMSYTFYPLYFLFVVAAAAVIFRRLNYVLLVALISTVSIHVLGFEHIRFAPGYNPIRHFVDVFVLASFFLYLSSIRKKQLFLFLALAFSLFGILASKEFGMILFISLAVTTTIYIVRCSEHKVRDFAILGTAAAVATILVLSVLAGSTGNKTLVYNLLGVSAPNTPTHLLVGLQILISLIYVFLLYVRKVNGQRWKYVVFFWFAYAQGLLVYFVWNPAPNHVTSLGPIWALLGAMFAKYALFWTQEKDENRIITLSVIAIALIVYVPTFAHYIVDQRNYYREFEDHKTYQWDFPTAKFVTTMDPMYFKDAVELIQKYEKNKGIYILSKYDNIIPYIAGKYSAMPFVEVGLSLVTDKEMKQCIEAINDNRPEILFIDTDISRSYLGDVYEPENKITIWLKTYDSSQGRAMVLKNFQRLYGELKEKYQLLEKGLLISVYKRRSTI